MLSRKKEDEKNERIIRGLLKSPVNKRCINCDSLGPQYICTNFWTFVCINCSGVHREFTHRVKSVSMAKFTSEEVGALKVGGNERAREIYFKEFDPNTHFLPDSSNIQRLRDFIRQVYVERRYTGERGAERNLRVKVERGDASENRRIDTYHHVPPSGPLYEDRYDNHYYDRSSPNRPYADWPSPGRRFDRSLKYNNDDRSPGFEYESRRFGSRRSTARFEVVDDRVRDDRFRNRNQNKKPEDQRPTEEASKAEGKSPRFQKDISSSSPRVSNINSPSHRMSNIAKDILGEDVPPLPTVDSPKTNDASELMKRTTSSSSLATGGTYAAEMKRVDSGSLIDFNEEPELPVTAAPTEPLSGRASQAPPNVNTLESALLLFTAPGAAHTGTASTTTIANPESVKTSDAGQLVAIQQQQPSLLPTDNGHQSPVQLVTQKVGTVSSQQWNSALAPNALGPLTSLPRQPSQLTPTTAQATGAATLALPPPAEAKPVGRKELPEDLFTMFYSPAPAPVPGWHTAALYHGMGYGVQYPQQPTAMPSKSTNPFDIGSEPSQAPISTFLPVTSLQLALPNMPATSPVPHTSNYTAASPQSAPHLFSYPSAMHPRAYMMQQTSNPMSPSGHRGLGGYTSIQAAYGTLDVGQQSPTAYSQQSAPNAFPQQSATAYSQQAASNGYSQQPASNGYSQQSATAYSQQSAPNAFSHQSATGYFQQSPSNAFSQQSATACSQQSASNAFSHLGGNPFG